MRPFLVLFPLIALLLAACGQQDPTATEAADQRPAYIVAVNSPLHYFARRLMPEGVEVRMPAPAGTDPAQWRPSVDEVLQLQGAYLVLLNGAGYSPWLDKVSLSDSQLVMTGEGARQQWIELQGEVTHSHGPEGEHAHGGYAFTTWMDLRIARVQAEAVAAALAERWPEQAPVVTGELEVLLAELDALDAGYSEIAQRLAGRPLIYSHPVYQYFERRYGLAGHSLHWEPDAMPTDEQWRELGRLAGKGALFVWEGEPLAEIAGRMDRAGLAWVVIDPGANTEQAWIELQRENLERLWAIVSP